MRSFSNILRVDPGFTAQGISAVNLSLPAARYDTAAAQKTFVDESLARIGALPGVTAAVATNFVPQGSGHSGIPVAVEGQPPRAPGDSAMAEYRVVSPGYFSALGIPILAGRSFTDGDARVAVPLIRWYPQQRLPSGFDAPQAAPVAVINQTMARRYWSGLDPIGRRFTALFSPPITVVGVARDSRNRALADEPGPEFYLSLGQEPQSKLTLLVRTQSPAESLPASLRAGIWSIDRDLPVSNVRTLDEIVSANLSLFRAITSLMSAFALFALVLMTLGVYAVVSYTAAQRTYEIGLRLALGAQRSDIRRLVVANGIGPTTAGIVLGLAGAYALARYASNLLYEVPPSDPLTYGALSALVLAITMLAAWVPARRAQRVDPVAVLRNE
jgi:predicted permease